MKETVLRIPISLHEELKVRVARDHTTMRSFMEAAIRAHLTEPTDSFDEELERLKPAYDIVQAAYPYAPDHKELHEKLEAILQSGDQRAVDRATELIEFFHERLRPRPPIEKVAGK